MIIIGSIHANLLSKAWSHKTKFINQGHQSNCEQSPENLSFKNAWNQSGSLWNTPASCLCPYKYSPSHHGGTEKYRLKGLFQDWNNHSAERSQVKTDNYFICAEQHCKQIAHNYDKIQSTIWQSPVVFWGIWHTALPSQMFVPFLMIGVWVFVCCFDSHSSFNKDFLLSLCTVFTDLHQRIEFQQQQSHLHSTLQGVFPVRSSSHSLGRGDKWAQPVISPREWGIHPGMKVDISPHRSGRSVCYKAIVANLCYQTQLLTLMAWTCLGFLHHC